MNLGQIDCKFSVHLNVYGMTIFFKGSKEFGIVRSFNMVTDDLVLTIFPNLRIGR